MPLTLQVSWSKKIGQPNYGSLGASCNLGLELDQSLLATDLDALQNRVRQAFAACRQSVQDELAEQTAGPKAVSSVVQVPAERNGHAAPGTANQNQHTLDLPAPASRKQFEYITQLANRIPGLDLRHLDALAARMFGTSLAVLGHADASSLIDVLKQIKDGAADLDSLFSRGVDE